MKPLTTLRIGASAGAALGLLGLFSCQQDHATVVAPKETQTTPASQVTAGPASWNDFVASVSEGRKTDPFGQYVSKSTFVASLPDQIRPHRPKRGDGQPASTAARSNAAESGEDAHILLPDDPDGGGGGGGGDYYPPAYTFVTSEGQSTGFGTTGSITDLKLITDAGYSYQFPNYNKLNLDLNKGVGGRYIYLTFHRGPAVQFASSATPLTRLSVLTRSFAGNYYIPGHENILMGQWLTNYVQTAPLDLNEGAGGDYIYSYESHDPSFGAPIREVGVIASRDGNIQPPAGWERVGVDLNKGAGGDYIYLCVKR